MARICELCKTSNDDDSQFCEKCGNPLVEEEEKDEAEKDDEDEAEEEEAPKPKSQDMKLLIIPLILVLIGAVFFLVMNMQTGNRKKEATAVVEKYLTAVKAEKYTEALQGATGIAMSPEYEKSFKEFLRQLTPDMPVNESLHKAMVDLASIDEGMEKYFQLNRRYPSELKELVPNYLEKLPDAPGGEYGYEKNLENYTIYVKGKTFAEAGLPENFPAFSKQDRLQAPDRKNVVGEWKVVNYQILDVQSLSKDKVTIKVKESAKFGPGNVDQENVYTVINQGGKWQIDPESSAIEMLSFTNAYTQMDSMGSAPEKKPEEEGDKKEEKKEEGKEEKKEEPKKVIVQMPIGMALLSFSKICENPANLKTRTQYQYRHCKKGLEKLAAGLMNYSNRHSGKYPNALLWLVPVYIDRIPLNPAAEQDTYSAGYQLDDTKERYTIVSQGAYFTSLGINEGFPQYSSKYRLIEKDSEIPVEPEVTPEPTESPDPNATPTPGEEGIEGSPTPGEETPSESPSPGAEVSPAPEGSPGATPGEEVKKEGEVKEEGKKPEEGKKEEVKPDDKKPEEKSEAKKPEEGKASDKPADAKKAPEEKKPEAKSDKQPEKKEEPKSDKIKIKKAEKKDK